MNRKTNDVISQNRIFAWVAIATLGLLLVPLTAMQFSAEVNWDGMDFMVMGALIFGMSSLFILVARKIPKGRRVLAGGIFIVVFLYIWAELAVGIFTNLGS